MGKVIELAAHIQKQQDWTNQERIEAFVQGVQELCEEFAVVLSPGENSTIDVYSSGNEYFSLLGIHRIAAEGVDITGAMWALSPGERALCESLS